MCRSYNIKKTVLLALAICIFSRLHGQVIPNYSITICSNASKGYYFFNAIKPGQKPPVKHLPFHLILDGKGQVVYFKKFPDGQSPSDFKLQPNGLISYYNTDKFFLMDANFSIVDSVYIKNKLLKDGHDLQVLPNGHFVILGMEEVKMDLRRYKLFNKNNSPGSDTATVRCGVVQEQDASKNVVFEWHSKNYYEITDVDTFYLSDPAKVDWPHFNAVEYDKDGNFLVSARNFNEITKVRRSDSTILWRLGGNRNQFTFTNDPAMFKAQHDARRTKNGNMTLYDNGINGKPIHASAAKEYKLDEKNLKAELVWSYTGKPNSFSTGIGSVQRLANGNTLTNYGISNNSSIMFNVVNPAGVKVFEILFKDTLRAYRAFNYEQLPWDLKRPKITCTCKNQKVVLEAKGGSTSYTWSNGSTTQSIEIIEPGSYSVFVPTNDGGFLSSQPYVIKDLKKPCSK